MMPYTGQRLVSPPPFLPARPLHPQGNVAPSMQLPCQPSRASSPIHQVTVKEEPQEDSPMPPPGLATERFTPYTGYLPRSSIKPTVIKQELGTTPSKNTECTAWNPSHRSSGTIAAAATRWLDSQETQSAQQKTVQGPVQTHFGSGTASWSPSAGVPYSWAYKYTPHYATVLAGEIPTEHLSRADRKDFLKVLEAAKATILELMPEERRIELNIDKVPADYTGLMKIARELDLIIPFKFIPLGPDIFPMDRMIRALQSYTSRLRRDQIRLQKDAARAEHLIAPDPEVASDSEPSNVIDKEKKDEYPSKPRKEKVRGKKGQPRPLEDEISAPEIQIKQKTSRKRKHGSEYDSEEVLGTKSSKKKKKRQKVSSPPVEQEISEPEVKEPEANTKKKKKRAMIQCPPTEDDIADKVIPAKERKKNRYPPSEGDVPEPATENRKKKTKKPSISEKEEHSETPQPKPNRPKKKKKAKRESPPFDETPAHNTPEPQFDANASFLSEALETTEERNHNLSQEIHNLRSILQAVGVGGVKLSVALTRMRHGQSAEEIFSAIKKEGS